MGQTHEHQSEQTGLDSCVGGVGGVGGSVGGVGGSVGGVGAVWSGGGSVGGVGAGSGERGVACRLGRWLFHWGGGVQCPDIVTVMASNVCQMVSFYPISRRDRPIVSTLCQYW